MKKIIISGLIILLTFNYSLKSIDKSFFKACKKGNLRDVEFMISLGKNINVKDSKGYTPLFFACKKGHLSVVKELLSHGANFNCIALDGTTPLYWACKCKNNDDVLKELSNCSDFNEVYNTECYKINKNLIFLCCFLLSDNHFRETRDQLIKEIRYPFRRNSLAEEVKKNKQLIFYGIKRISYIDLALKNKNLKFVKEIIRKSGYKKFPYNNGKLKSYIKFILKAQSIDISEKKFDKYIKELEKNYKKGVFNVQDLQYINRFLKSQAIENILNSNLRNQENIY